MKRILISLQCLLLATSPCLAQETSGKAIDASVSKALTTLHRQLDKQFSKLRKSNPDQFKQQCAAGDCVRLCAGSQTCTCTSNGTSCSCSACQ
jgi:hypothetical protein